MQVQQCAIFVVRRSSPAGQPPDLDAETANRRRAAIQVVERFIQHEAPASSPSRATHRAFIR